MRIEGRGSGSVKTMMVYMLFRVIVYTFISKQAISDYRIIFEDHPGKRCVCYIAGNHGGLPLHLVFEGKVAFVGADPCVCP